jgi:hypothetical protein
MPEECEGTPLATALCQKRCLQFKKWVYSTDDVEQLLLGGGGNELNGKRTGLRARSGGDSKAAKRLR